MKVERISASIRFSKALGDGQHKTVEIGAESTLDPKEAWQGALSHLYTQLGQELRTLWATNDPKPAGDGPQAATETPPAPEPAQPEHWCEEHQAQFQRKSKDGKTWYSHKAPDGNWCNEK